MEHMTNMEKRSKNLGRTHGWGGLHSSVGIS